METIFGIIIGLFILIFLVVIHELGHAIIAHRNGVVVEEFGIGFPPKIWSKKLKNGVLFSLNALPLGGFVRLQGEYDAAHKKGDYGKANLWQKTKILLAGVAINWLFAVVLVSVLAAIGIPKILDNQFSMPGDTVLTKSPVTVTAIIEGLPASNAGLKPGDEIISINNEAMGDPQKVTDIATKLKGQEASIVFDRDGNKQTVSTKIRSSNEDGKGYLGIGSSQSETMKSTWSAPIVGFVTTGQFTITTFQGLGELVINLISGVVMQFSSSQDARVQANENLSSAGEGVAGPIGILGTIFPAAKRAGFSQLMFLTAIISLTLAVMNILPLPALDGGRWVVTMVYRIRKKKLTKEIEEKINGTGFMLLMVLVIAVTVIDVRRIIG